jgi:N-acetyl-anhydromuramyl-L-alanine amidase AmpD
MEIEKLHNGLTKNQYYAAKYPKKYLFLHHTAGRSVEDAIEWWNSAPDHVSTAYIIGRTGRIFECFPPEYWAYALGLKGGTTIEKASIQVELVAWGSLQERSGRFYSYAKTEVPKAEVVEFKDLYRGKQYYQGYTPEQLKALEFLIPHILDQFSLKVQDNDDLYNFHQFRPDWQKNPIPGIWSHTTVRRDKSDIIPQKELMDLVRSYGT